MTRLLFAQISRLLCQELSVIYQVNKLDKGGFGNKQIPLDKNESNEW